MIKQSLLVASILLVLGCSGPTEQMGGQPLPGSNPALGNNLMAINSSAMAGMEMERVLLCLGQPNRAVQSEQYLFWSYPTTGNPPCRADVVITGKRVLQTTFMVPTSATPDGSSCEKFVARCTAAPPMPTADGTRSGAPIHYFPR